MISVETIKEKLEELTANNTRFLVDVTVSSGNDIYIEIDDAERFITVVDCIEVSKGLENELDRENQDFSLQVSSPGLSNPFKVKEQYLKNVGREVRVLKSDGIVVKGELSSATIEEIKITSKEKQRIEGRKAKEWVTIETVLNYNEIKETTIVISFN
ncbi:MAG: ribosome maturation factor RimP [Patiriisocius sp.]|jgi:ribosome maturation factor RimP